MSCTPLFLDSSVIDAAYNGMCKQVLWPAFHNIDLLDISKSGWGQSNVTSSSSGTVVGEYGFGSSVEKFVSNWDQSRLDGWWGAYVAVNRYFADALAERMGVDDMVWVHDYHLVLLPKMLDTAEKLMRGRRTVQMVFYLHIPFPTSQGECLYIVHMLCVIVIDCRNSISLEHY